MDAGIWRDLIAVAGTSELEDARWLLRVGAWRPVVVGAWLSLGYQRDEIGDSVDAALRAAVGSLTVPPLAAAAVTLLGRDSEGALRACQAWDDKGSARALNAALAHLGLEPSDAVANPDRAGLAELVRLAHEMRAALGAACPD